MKKILHIANGFTTNILYDELFSRLNKTNKQTIIAPTFNYIDIKKFPYTILQYHRHNSLLNRLQFNKKINQIWSFTDSTINLSDFDVLHAHTLFSDGAIAYKAKIKYGLPYIVAIRNTDINIFFKYFIHLRDLGIRILENSTKVILISPIYRNRLKKYIPQDKYALILPKLEIIPNGVNDIWLDNRIKLTKKINSPIRLIFCGSFDSNKNILNLIKAAERVNYYYPLELKLIGYQPEKRNNYIDSIIRQSKIKNFKIEIIPRIPHTELIKYYKEGDIFVMPSHTETFGLVYVEALSQGLPIIFTQNEGFDGYFKDGEVGYSVNSHSTKSIAYKIIEIIKNYNLISKNISKIDLDLFSWDNVASRYNKIYSSIKKY